MSEGQPPAGEPIAVVGAGCRFAGSVDSPDDYWELLVNRRDGIGEIPDERWQVYRDLGSDYARVLRQATRWGGFLGDIEGFDAAFFGLTPREAELMDPQQRLLLELAWEALEHAGIPPVDLAGSDTGVFVGIGSDDYGRRLLEDLPTIEAWTGIGSAMCAVANRISYALDLRGPSLAVDTACSASLVAVHLACQSLRAGESRVALAGGVNLIISPGLTLTLDAAGAMAPDGRCKSFDASADGYGRGEGGGVLVLKRLSDAQRDGDRILAVILGSGVSQDGRTNGIMAPNGAAQRDLLDQTCRRAGITPESVDYVEAHGTGTRLGDPLEAGALSAVYGKGRPATEPCLIGSVKSNIGHLEAAAGVASIIKATLALNAAEIPPSLNFTSGNPGIDWDNGGLRVVTERTPWPRRDGPRRAGVSGFGYGGTIAHIVLEQAAEPAPEVVAEDGTARLYPLSARSNAVLREQAGSLAGWLSDGGAGAPLAGIGHTLALRRSHLEHRAAVVATDRKELEAKLRLIAGGDQSREVATGTVPSPPGGLVWVYSGHGSHWVGMGRDLLASEPAFAAVIDELEPIFQSEIGFSPRGMLIDGDFATVDRIQTMIFAMQVGLTAVWRSFGVTPAAVIGHSVGEIAAAVTCGALSLPDGARLICRRSRLLRRVAGKGAMAMTNLSFDEATERLAGRTDVVAAIAASPLSTVVAGDPAAVEELAARWREDGVQVRPVASDVAFHSPQMDPLLADLAAAAADLSPREPRIPMYTTALADPRSTPVVNGDYWAANLRNCVRLAVATQAAAEDGYRAFVEIAAHPVVAHSVGETLGEKGFEDVFVGSSLRRDQPEQATLLAAVGAVHCHGFPVDWKRLQPAGDLVTLPSIRWRRQSHWHGSTPTGSANHRQHDVDSHALLGEPVAVAGSSVRLWRSVLDDSCRPYPGSHTINGTEIVPAAVLINTFLTAAAGGDGYLPPLRDMSLRLPLMAAERRELQVVRDDSGLRLASRAPDGEGTWLTHTTALSSGPGPDLPAWTPSPEVPLERADPGDVQRHLASVGVPTMGFMWTVEELLRGDGVIRARVSAEQPERAPATWAPVLDAALSIAPSVYPGPPALRMVAQVGEVRVDGPPQSTVDIQITMDGTGEQCVEVLVADTRGQVVARIAGLRYGGIEQGPTAVARPEDLVHEVVWRDWAPGSTPDTARECVLVGPDASHLTALRDRLAAAGASCRVVSGPDELDGLGGSTDVLVVPPLPAKGDSITDAAARSTWLLLSTAQRLARLEGATLPRLWCLTIGVRESLDEASLAHSPLWGLGRVIAGEHGEVWGGIIDLDRADPFAAAGTVLDILRAAPAEDVMSVRDGVASAARLVRTEREAVRGPVQCHADGTYLITGGLGILGLRIAGWLAERGARRLVLAGRRAFPSRACWDDPVDEATRRQIAGVRALEALGVTVKVVSLDVADIDRAAELLTPDALGLPPIRGVVHAAGVLDNRLVSGVDDESVRAVMRPKVDGAWVLHRLFPPGSLDFFVLFSSCGQLLGLPGQASYGSANAFLDALATHRNAAAPSGDTTSFGWTSWRGQGMAVNEVVDRELRARGVADISASEAFDAWDFAERRGAGYFPVLRTVAIEGDNERLPLLSELSTAEPAATPAGQDTEVLTDLPPEQLRERLLADVGSQIAGEMRMSTAALDLRRSLVEQGLDSVMTIVIRRRLEKRFGHKLPATLLWHQPTVTAIADHLVELLSVGSPE